MNFLTLPFLSLPTSSLISRYTKMNGSDFIEGGNHSNLDFERGGGRETKDQFSGKYNVDVPSFLTQEDKYCTQ